MHQISLSIFGKQIISYLKHGSLFLILFCLSFSVWGQNENYKIRKVVIDAGHGGKDPGASGKRNHEKDIVLKISLLVGEYIEKYIPDVEVIYTRKTDIFIPVEERGEIANTNHADIFISIHANANDKKTIYGTETYVMGLDKAQENLEVAKLENSVVTLEKDYKAKYVGFDPESPESEIIFSLMQNTFLDQSLLFAKLIEEQFGKRAGRNSRGVRQANLIVLWNTSMPSVLIETGYLSNAKEEKFLASTYGQEIIASAIFRAFRDYKNALESHAGINVVSAPPKKEVQKKEITKDDKIFFSVQVQASTEKISLNSRIFKGVKGIKEYTSRGKFIYVVGESNDLKNIVSVQNKIREKIPDAFVVAFRNDEKIPVRDAINYLKKP